MGFADAFNQIPPSVNPFPVDDLLTARVTLLASAPGTLNYTWETTFGLVQLDFFGLSSAAGGSVTIVPEPATGLLLALGLVATACLRRRRP